MFEVTVRSEFAAAHSLRGFDTPCKDLHGHNWQVSVTIAGHRLLPNGVLIDFDKVGQVLNDLLREVDHKYLNELAPFDKVSPTAENIARWAYERLSQAIDNERIRVKQIEVFEYGNARVSYSPD